MRKILRSISLSIVLVLGTTQLVKALPMDSNSDGSFQSNQKDASDSLGIGISPMDLLNKINLAPGRSSADFNSDSQEDIQSAAAKFKQQQMQTIQGPTPDSKSSNP